MRFGRHQGARARHLRRGAFRRTDARSRATLLVALRNHARASSRHRRQASDRKLERRHRARQGSRRARIHGAQDQHRHAGQRRHVVQRLRWLYGAKRRMGPELADRAHREAHRDDSRRGRPGLRHQRRSEFSFQARGVHAHCQSARALQPALAGNRQSRSRRRTPDQTVHVDADLHRRNADPHEGVPAFLPAPRG